MKKIIYFFIMFISLLIFLIFVPAGFIMRLFKKAIYMDVNKNKMTYWRSLLSRQYKMV